ncbi:lysozyme inhibitor LprI family protein [Deminuibacter soli]|nr:lysozyme inhibitor LprI family protein [Deminuibacter soli]
MKKCVTLIAVLLCLCASLHAQAVDGLTPQQQKAISQKIEKLTAGFKQQLIKANENPSSVEFKLDTFRIERWAAACLELDESDASMRQVEAERAGLYDSLLNKYYHKLNDVLKGDDRKILQQAQRNWLQYRDSELQLLSTVAKDEYSGGGTIQRLINASEYTSIVEGRTIAIFNHYQRAIQAE